MRALFFAMTMAWAMAACMARAQEKVVESFSDANTLATPSFQVPDKWEVQWDGPAAISITVLSPDGTVVTGAAGWKGSLYQPKGGTFHLVVSRNDGQATTPWHVSVVELGPAGASSGTGVGYISAAGFSIGLDHHGGRPHRSTSCGAHVRPAAGLAGVRGLDLTRRGKPHRGPGPRRGRDQRRLRREPGSWSKPRRVRRS